MNDVLKIALARRGELRAELAEIDEFIRMADSLLRNARGPAGPAAEEPLILDRPIGHGRAAEADRAPDQSRPDPSSTVALGRTSETVRAVGGTSIERAGGAEHDADTDPAERAQPDEAPVDADEDAEEKPATRTFPWSNAQPIVRKSDADEAGPVRRNLMRREAS